MVAAYSYSVPMVAYAYDVAHQTIANPTQSVPFQLDCIIPNPNPFRMHYAMSERGNNMCVYFCSAHSYPKPVPVPAVPVRLQLRL